MATALGPIGQINLSVNDIAGAYRQLQGRGTAFEGPPHLVHQDDAAQLWLAFFRHPRGRLLALMEERAFPAAET